MHTIRIDRPCGKSHTFQHGDDHPLHMDFVRAPGEALSSVEARLDVYTKTPGYTHIKGEDAPAIYELITSHIKLKNKFTHVTAAEIRGLVPLAEAAAAVDKAATS